jgi:protein TonB
MWREGYLRRGLAAAVIVVAHAIVLYALAVISPVIRAATSEAPLAVRFISPRPDSYKHWQPPQVSVATPMVLARQPRMPPVEVAVVSAPAGRAVSLASHMRPVSTKRPDPGTPKAISAVEYVHEPVPRYPRQSRRLREEGLVVLRVVIDERGKACSIDVERSSGYARLDVAAREAVQRAEFRPYVEDGAPRRAQVLIPIEFSLKRGAA